MALISDAGAQAVRKATLNIGRNSVYETETPEGTKVKRLHIEEASYLERFDYQPTVSYMFEGIAAGEISIEDAVYQPLSPEAAMLLNGVTLIEANPKTWSEVYVSRKKPASLIYLLPLRIHNGKYELLKSFTLLIAPAPWTPQVSTAAKKNTEATPAHLRTSETAGSVLAQGEFYKIAVEASGVYKITGALLASMGITTGSIDPRNIKIYGNGGGMLPQPNSTPRINDLYENSIFVAGENDGRFDADDYILFYGESAHSIFYHPNTDKMRHTKNIYDEKNYYFLTIGSSPGKRITAEAEETGAQEVYSSYNAFEFKEDDLFNLIQSGKKWYGDDFRFTTERNYTFNTPDAVSGSTGFLEVSAFNRSKSSSSVVSTFELKVNNNLIGNIAITGSGNVSYTSVGKEKTETFTYTANPGNTFLNINFRKTSDPAAEGYLNYATLNYIASLNFRGNQFGFRNFNSQNNTIAQYNVSFTGVSNGNVWDVTSPLDPVNQALSLSGGTFSFKDQTEGKVREYVIFRPEVCPAPSFIKKVANQDLHAYATPGNIPHMVIVTTEAFMPAAERLAEFRRTHDGLKVVTVTTEQVYNEFSSGRQDITAIRDFMRLVYDNSTGTDSLRYLLLFGDCSYDYKDRVPGNTNFVPVWESENSIHPIESQSSDDYYGFLDSNEGIWSETGPTEDRIHYLDIGIGRLPVRNLAEGEGVVSKIIRYHTSRENLGNHRQRICLIADDGDGGIHLNQADNIYNAMEVNYPWYHTLKIYIDAFNQISRTDGERAPNAENLLQRRMNDGLFMVNYIGHGNPVTLSSEDILNYSKISQWKNENKLPFFIIATCDFGIYDNPAMHSGSELLCVKPDGGGIGVLTSTRTVYSHSNFRLNKAFYEYAFSKEDGQYLRLGDIMRLTKNASVDNLRNRNYSLLGDPSMMLEYPQKNIMVENPDTLRSLGRITFTGTIKNNDGTTDENFNGRGFITVYDKPTTVQTLGAFEKGARSPIIPFQSYNNIIFQGQASVVAGNFNISFVVPKDIVYDYGNGKISMYAHSNNSTMDAGTQNAQFVTVGGTDPNAPDDNTPPQISLYMDDTTFRSGGLTGQNPVFLAKLYDENGINISSSGIGHELLGTLNNDRENPHIMNEYYTSEPNTYTRGTVEYPLNNLAPGNHSIRMKAWDTYNNSSESYLEFIVAGDEKIALKNVLNYPNPFFSNTNFQFDHNRPGETLSVTVDIYTIEGRLVKSLNTVIFESSTHVSDIEWDGRDTVSDPMGKGIYLYKVTVMSEKDGSKAHQIQKLVLLN